MAESLVSGLTGMLEGWGGWVSEKAMALINQFFPPEKRAEWIEKLKAFTVKHPKVTAFLLTNTALSGLPLFLFILFGLTVFTFSLIVALIVGLVIAVLFSLSAVGIALLFLFPLIFFTTLAACFFFLLGLGGYYIFKKFNQGGVGAPGDAIGDKINSITGGKLNFLMGEAREKHAEDRLGDAQKTWSHGASGYYGDKEHAYQQNGPQQNGTNQNANKQNGHANGDGNGTPKKQAEHSKGTTSGSDAKSHANNATDGVRKNLNADSLQNQASKAPVVGDATKQVKGTPKKLNGATGTVKGTASGATTGAATGAIGGVSGLG